MALKLLLPCPDGSIYLFFSLLRFLFFQEERRDPDPQFVEKNNRNCHENLVEGVRGRCQNSRHNKGNEHGVFPVLRKGLGRDYPHPGEKDNDNRELEDGPEGQLQTLSDEDLRAKTAAFRERVAAAANGDLAAALEEILPEAFAVCRETARRVLAMRHFDVQLIGGMVLHEGKIAEMATGEGKTLVATLPAYLNALSGRGVHVITVNDYLAKRD
ncbi:MAG: hypothetical protein HGA78_10770, partial [Nitrospirales bacterium]|nr:hypothetical protein [Nitrospirales bacterium]